MRATGHAKRVGTPTDTARRPVLGGTTSGLGPAIVSLILTTALIAFFFAYAWGLTDVTPAQPVPGAALDETAPAHRAAETLVGATILGRLVATVVLTAPLLLAVRRWRLPVGTATCLFVSVATLMHVLADDAPAVLLVAPLLAGVVADLVIGWQGIDQRATMLVIGLVVPLLPVGLHFLLIAVAVGLAWPLELTVGTAVLSGLVGFGLLVLTGAPTASSPGDRRRADQRATRG